MAEFDTLIAKQIGMALLDQYRLWLDAYCRNAKPADETETERLKMLKCCVIDLGNPLVVHNRHALWAAIRQVHEAFGEEVFDL
jgi:hypothetical protein